MQVKYGIIIAGKSIVMLTCGNLDPVLYEISQTDIRYISHKHRKWITRTIVVLICLLSNIILNIINSHFIISLYPLLCTFISSSLWGVLIQCFCLFVQLDHLTNKCVQDKRRFLPWPSQSEQISDGDMKCLIYSI